MNERLAHSPTSQERAANQRELSKMHRANRFRLMFGMPLLPEDTMKDPSDLAIRTINFLRALDTEEASKLADEHFNDDRRLVPSCGNCRRYQRRTGWCDKIEHFTRMIDEKECFESSESHAKRTENLTK